MDGRPDAEIRNGRAAEMAPVPVASASCDVVPRDIVRVSVLVDGNAESGILRRSGPVLCVPKSLSTQQRCDQGPRTGRRRVNPRKGGKPGEALGGVGAK